MKQIKLILFLFGMVSFSAFAQNRNQQSASTSQAGVQQTEISGAIKDCPDLQKQLIQLFGADYTVNSPKVKEQLQKNITDKKQNRCVRKSSLKAIYGTDYVNKLYLIDNNQ